MNSGAMSGGAEPPEMLDASGLQCPLPVLKARRALKDKPAGARLLVISTDPAAPLDFRHFCNASGNELVEQSEHDGRFCFLIRKG